LRQRLKIQIGKAGFGEWGIPWPKKDKKKRREFGDMTFDGI